MRISSGSQPLTPGRFLQRDNRFRVVVEVDGRETAAHLPNSGRLGELLTPGREVRLASMPNPRRKTPYDLKLVRYAGVWVSVDARLPNPLFAEAFRRGHLPGFEGYAELHPEVTLDDVQRPDARASRIDFLLTGPAGRCWVETKSVTLVEAGVARFPDAPTGRGRRHLEALVRAVEWGDQAAVIFVVQRPDARAFEPHAVADPLFAQTLHRAQTAGVTVLAHRCCVSEDEITLDTPIPVDTFTDGFSVQPADRPR
jgi:sugar fermentation stimulation protein A